MTRYWISWVEPSDDPRPAKVPPTDVVLGYWCSGSRADGSASTMCALLSAVSIAAAYRVICEYWKPSEWRFCETQADDWLPGDRFPMDETAETPRDELQDDARDACGS